MTAKELLNILRNTYDNYNVMSLIQLLKLLKSCDDLKRLDLLECEEPDYKRISYIIEITLSGLAERDVDFNVWYIFCNNTDVMLSQVYCLDHDLREYSINYDNDPIPFTLEELPAIQHLFTEKEREAANILPQFTISFNGQMIGSGSISTGQLTVNNTVYDWSTILSNETVEPSDFSIAHGEPIIEGMSIVPPEQPEEGTIWFSSASGINYVFRNGSWREVRSPTED